MPGIYVTTKLSDETCSRLKEFVDKLPLPIGSRMKEASYHITLAYSREGFLYKHNSMLDGIVAFPEAWDIFGTDDEKVLVLPLSSRSMQRRYKQLCAQGYKSSYATYKPHITVGMAPSEAVDIKALEVPTFPIQIDYEYSEPLDDDYKYDPADLCESFQTFYYSQVNT